MHEVHKLSEREWPYNLWDDILKMRSDNWYGSNTNNNEDELLQGCRDDPYPPMLLVPILESVLADALTEVQLKAVHLRYEQRMTYQQVAEAMGVHHSRVHMVVLDALRRLEESRNYFRLKAVPVIEVRKKIRSVNALQEENEKLTQQIKTLEQQNADLKSQIDDISGRRKRIEEAHQRVKPESPIGELDLNPRAYNTLDRTGIKTVGDLIGHTEGELKRLHQMGKVTLANIIGALYDCGYSLKEAE